MASIRRIDSAHTCLITTREAERIIFDPWVYNRISDDSCYNAEIPDIPYTGGFLDGKLVSVFITIPFKDGFKAHFQVLKDYKKHARELAGLFLKDAPRPLYAFIPSLYHPYINFCKKF